MKNKLGFWENLKELLIASVLLCVFFLVIAIFFPSSSNTEKWMLGPAIAAGGRNPAWSPDGSQIAFQCEYYHQSDFLDPDVWDDPTWTPPREICIYSLNSGNIRRITYGRFKGLPVWSNDGSQLAWHNINETITIWDTKWHVVVRTIPDIGNPEDYQSVCKNFTLTARFQELPSPCLKTMEKDLENVSWSMDGKNVAYTKSVPNDNDSETPHFLFIQQDDEIIYQSRIPVMEFSSPPRWSPDGTILSWQPDDENTDYAFTFRTTGETILVEGDHYPEVYWSPSGTKIALIDLGNIEIQGIRFTTNPFSYEITYKIRYDIYKRTGGRAVNLSWSPDEKYIVYELMLNPYDHQIWILDIESGEQTLVLKQ